MLMAASVAAAAVVAPSAAAEWHPPVLQLLWVLVVGEQLLLLPEMLLSLRAQVQPDSPGLTMASCNTLEATQGGVPAEGRVLMRW
jgi:hypothetical protein